MIIFGARGVTYTQAKGTFYCPGCDREGVEYKHQRSRRFVTLYYVPLIPLKSLGEYIECQVCQSTYQLGVLKATAAEHRAFEAEGGELAVHPCRLALERRQREIAPADRVEP